jgi:hypothetical protein
MFNKSCYVTQSIWIEVVDYYNAGLTFNQMQKHLQENFSDFGIPQGASTSLVIQLYRNYDNFGIDATARMIYRSLDELLKSKKNNK